MGDMQDKELAREVVRRVKTDPESLYMGSWGHGSYDPDVQEKWPCASSSA